MEQSTRYQSYTDRPGGRWRYHLDPAVDGDPRLGAEYRRVLDGVFATYAELVLHELRQVIPSFLERVDLPDRGVAWTRYLAETAEETAKVVDALLGDEAPSQEAPSVRLVEFDPAGEDKVLTAIAYPLLRIGEAEVAERVG